MKTLIKFGEAQADMSFHWPRTCNTVSGLICLYDAQTKQTGPSHWSIFMFREGKIRSENVFAQSDTDLRYSLVNS